MKNVFSMTTLDEKLIKITLENENYHEMYSHRHIKITVIIDE